MQISLKTWTRYKDQLNKISTKAYDEMLKYIESIGGYGEHAEEVIAYAYGLSSRYGEAAGAAACEMYDAVAAASEANVPPAIMAETPNFKEVEKAIRGTVKNSSELQIPSTVNRMVKRVGADTTQKNAIRDGAEWAWIPGGGETCAFCIMLASQGWVKASKNALRNGHAEHIHANCKCTYAIRFNSNTTVAGYNPQKYKDIYYAGMDADEDYEHEIGGWKGALNAIRRDMYHNNKEYAEKIKAQKRAAYAKRKEMEANENKPDFFTGPNGKTLPQVYEGWIGENKMSEYIANAQSEELVRYIKSDYRKTSFIGDGSTAAIREFEITTGLNCGRNGNSHRQKVEDLSRQINKLLLKNLPEDDKIFLREMLGKFEGLS